MKKHVSTKTPYTKVNRNTLASFIKSRLKVLVTGKTYYAGKNAAKRMKKITNKK
jgi:hypothetical protein